MDFRPTETPMGVPVCNVFEMKGRVYVVDVHGTLFQLDTLGDDPELWRGLVVCYL